MSKIYLLVGCPGSGKTWITDKLKDKYNVIPHDDYIHKDYVSAIIQESLTTTKPILIETPFSMSQIIDPLEARGIEVEPVIIFEDEKLLKARYYNREKKDIPKGHISRMYTYAQRAKDNGYFYGDSNDVLEYLQKKIK